MTPKTKMVLGLVFLPPFLFQQSLVIRIFQVVLVVGLYIFQGGKFRILPNIVLTAGIMTAYMIRPSGVVILQIGSFSVTEGALFSGISKSLLIIGLVYISRLSVSSQLKFESPAGNLLGRVFYYFEAITGSDITFPYKSVYKRGRGAILMNYLDTLLFSMENKTEDTERNIEYSKFKGFSPVLVFILLFILTGYITLFI